MTFADVTKLLDLKTTSVTYYFRFKEDLAAAVIDASLSRLEHIARRAAALPTPRERIALYVALYIEHYATSISGGEAPWAILSEIRTMDEAHRRNLTERYQDIFRTVRSFFLSAGSQYEKAELNVRTQILNEALFWSDSWLKHHAISDFPNIARRLAAILTDGIALGHVSMDLERWEADPPGDAEQPPFLKVATRLLNAHGYKGASIDRIAGELGVTRGSFYHHIDKKDDLVLECSRESYRRLKRLEEAARRPTHSAWGNFVDATGSAICLQLHHEYPLLRSTALQAIPGKLRQIALSQAQRTSLWLAGTLSDAMATGDVRICDASVASHIIMSAINSAYDMRHWASRLPRRDSIKIYMTALLHGLVANAGPQEGTAIFHENSI